MKNLMVIVIGIFLSTTAFAQNSSEAKSTTLYCCSKAKCDHRTATAGNCPDHKKPLVMEGKFYCPMHPEVTSDAEGKCSKCNMALVKMETSTNEKYCCSMCGYIPPVKGQCPHITEAVIKDGELKCALCYDKSGKCPKCGTEMQKVEIKKKKK